MNKKQIAITLGIMCLILTLGTVIQIKTINGTGQVVSQNFSNNELRDQVLRWKERYDTTLANLQNAETKLEQVRATASANTEGSEEKIDDNTYILSGSMTIYDVNKLLKANIPEGDYDTISGFLQDKLKRIPEDEETPVIETKEVTYKIEEYEDKRILKIKACKNNIEEETEEDE